MTVPSRSFKIQLQQAGLGRKKICFNSKANATEVKMKLEESYSKLIAGGGFEILRRGLSPSELSIIPPNSGYIVLFLRDCAGLGQAIAYIRPVQCNLNQDPIKAVLEDCQDSGDVPKVACINCSLEIPVTHVRQHLDVCCKDDELSWGWRR